MCAAFQSISIYSPAPLARTAKLHISSALSDEALAAFGAITTRSHLSRSE